MRPTPLALAALCTAALTGAALQPWQPLYAQEAASVNRVIEQLLQGRPAIGTFTRTARSALDFAVIDEQYGDFDIDGVREAVVAIRAGDGAPAITPVVRIPLATDLAASAGEEGPNAPRVDALVQEVLEACLARNIPCGYPIVAPTREDAGRETARRLAEGFKVLAVMTIAR